MLNAGHSRSSQHSLDATSSDAAAQDITLQLFSTLLLLLLPCLLHHLMLHFLDSLVPPTVLPHRQHGPDDDV